MAPIDASDQAQIIKMMDDPDGAMIVRKGRKHNHSLNLASSGGGVVMNVALPLDTVHVAAATTGVGGVAKRIQKSELLKPLLDKEKISNLSSRPC